MKITPAPLSQSAKEVFGPWVPFLIFALIVNAVVYFLGWYTLLGFTVAGSAMVVIVGIKHKAEKEIREINQTYGKK